MSNISDNHKKNNPGRHPLVLKNGRQVGYTEGDKAVLPIDSKTYLADGQGHSIDEHVFRCIETRECSIIERPHRKNGSIRQIETSSFKASSKVFNYGWGPKLCAPDCLYTIIKPAKKENSNE